MLSYLYRSLSMAKTTTAPFTQDEIVKQAKEINDSYYKKNGINVTPAGFQFLKQLVEIAQFVENPLVKQALLHPEKMTRPLAFRSGASEKEKLDHTKKENIYQVGQQVINLMKQSTSSFQELDSWPIKQLYEAIQNAEVASENKQDKASLGKFKFGNFEIGKFKVGMWRPKESTVSKDLRKVQEMLETKYPVIKSEQTLKK